MLRRNAFSRCELDLSLTVNSADEAERIDALLSDGGQVFMPMEETFFVIRLECSEQVRDLVDDSASKPQNPPYDTPTRQKCEPLTKKRVC